MKYAKKSLGQNFLNDQNIIKKIINLVNIRDQHVLEIGPGKGALTDQILKKKPKSLILIEKDYILFEELKSRYVSNKKIKIYNEDILKFDVEKTIKKNSIVFGNLPYNISSQILVKFIKFKKWPPKYSFLIFMFQKELAERIVGKYDTPQYGRLSILVNFRLKNINKFDISPNCFIPKPKVISTILLLEPIHKTSYDISIDNLEKVTNALFSNKRKMINKSIKKIFANKNTISLINNLDLKARPSDLKPDKFYGITECFEKI
jgi:16S rRNA (adenine1518-N6/adenine1519-N6)-dimethyltransferase